MNVWRARFAVIAVFVAGFVCGVAAVYLYVLRVEQQVLREPDTVAQLILLKLDRELDLSDEQRTRIHQAIRQTRTEVLQITDTMLPRMVEIFDRGAARIRETLTPEQREKFDRLLQGRRQRMLDDIRK